MGFIKPYHMGLATLIIARMAATPTKYPGLDPEDSPLFFGLGSSLIVAQVVGGKTFEGEPYEIVANLALAGILLGWMFGVK